VRVPFQSIDIKDVDNAIGVASSWNLGDVNGWVGLVDAAATDHDHLVFYQVAGDPVAVNFVGVVDAEPLERRETEDVCVAESVG